MELYYTTAEDISPTVMQTYLYDTIMEYCDSLLVELDDMIDTTIHDPCSTLSVSLMDRTTGTGNNNSTTIGGGSSNGSSNSNPTTTTSTSPMITVATPASSPISSPALSPVDDVDGGGGVGGGNNNNQTTSEDPTDGNEDEKNPFWDKDVAVDPSPPPPVGGNGTNATTGESSGEEDGDRNNNVAAAVQSSAAAENEAGIASGGIVGIVLVALLAVVMLLLFVKRKRDEHDRVTNVKHIELEDDYGDVYTDNSVDSPQRLGNVGVSVVNGDDIDNESGWELGPPPRDIIMENRYDVHHCNSAMCQICHPTYSTTSFITPTKTISRGKASPISPLGTTTATSSSNSSGTSSYMNHSFGNNNIRSSSGVQFVPIGTPPPFMKKLENDMPSHKDNDLRVYDIDDTVNL